MSEINPNQVQAMAIEIVKLLDANESSGETRNDNQIEASIWNKFVGEGKPKEEQIGNGKKSTINHFISYSDAVKSIVSYINKRGIDAIQAALKSLGIDWSYSSKTKEQKTTDNVKNSTTTEATEVPPEGKYTKEQQSKILEALWVATGDAHFLYHSNPKYLEEYNRIKNLRETLKASNGMTFNDTIEKLNIIMQKYPLDIYENNQKRPATPRELSNHLKTLTQPDYMKKQYQDDSAMIDEILKAQEELLEKNPELNTYW